MKHKLHFSLLALLCLISSIAWAQTTFVQGSLKFTENASNTLSVAKRDNNISGDIVIPATVSYGGTTYSVTDIPDAAFASTAISSVSIPATVTSLGARAFAHCTALERITIKDGNEALWVDSRGDGQGTFYNCTAPKTIYMGRNLILTDNLSPFTNTTSVEFGSKVTDINSMLFYDASELYSIKMSNSIASIGSYAFYSAGDDPSIAEMAVQMSNKVTYIADHAFEGCTTLRSIALPQTLTSIGDAAFANTNLTGISIPASLTSLPSQTFAHCTALERIIIEDGDEALWIDSRGDGQGTFYNCTAPKTIYMGRNLILTDNLSPFTNTTSVEFGKKVTELPSVLFGNATELTEVSVPWQTPINIEADAFSNVTYENAVLSVPNGTANKYKAHDVWKKFQNIQDGYYTITVVGAGISVSSTKVRYGEDVIVTIPDDPDRVLVSLTVNGINVTAQVANSQYTIQNITENITVEATFKATKEFITMTDMYATFSCSEDLDFTGSSLRAYIASGFNKATNQVLLTRVKDVPAGTGVFLIGTAGETYKIAYATTSSIYMNFFQPNLTRKTVSATSGGYSNYIFDEQGGEPGFYPISGSTTLQAQTAYLQLPSSFVGAGVKVNVVFEDDIIDGIADLEDFEDLNSLGGIFNLSGQRLGKIQKGINIVNGKKILVK